jgi:large subunit ribosomal protein L21
MQAVIELQGQQFLVSSNDKIIVNRISQNVGDEFTVERVLCLLDGEKVTLGKPYLTSARIKAKILNHPRGKKIRVLKYKPKDNYHVSSGHRQDLTEVQIIQIA